MAWSHKSLVWGAVGMVSSGHFFLGGCRYFGKPLVDDLPSAADHCWELICGRQWRQCLSFMSFLCWLRPVAFARHHDHAIPNEPEFLLAIGQQRSSIPCRWCRNPVSRYSWSRCSWSYWTSWLLRRILFTCVLVILEAVVAVVYVPWELLAPGRGSSAEGENVPNVRISKWTTENFPSDMKMIWIVSGLYLVVVCCLLHFLSIWPRGDQAL